MLSQQPLGALSVDLAHTVLMKLVKTCVFSSAKIGSYCNQVSRDRVGVRRRQMEDAEQLEAVAYIFMCLFRCSLFCVGVILRA